MIYSRSGNSRLREKHIQKHINRENSQTKKIKNKKNKNEGRGSLPLTHRKRGTPHQRR